MREDRNQKARRLLTEGRVTVTAVTPTSVEALVRGDSGVVYGVAWQRNHGWFCPCESRSSCSHLAAVKLVVVTS